MIRARTRTKSEPRARESIRRARSLGARAITRLERRRGGQIAVVLVISVGVGAFTAHLVRSAQVSRQRWATDVPVLLAAETIAADDAIDEDEVNPAVLPLALVARDALSVLPTGARLAVDVEAGTVITDSLLVKDAVVVPESWRTVALPDDVDAPPLAVGQVVDIVAHGAVLAEGALVATLSPITVAVDPGAAPAVAAAARLGEVSLVSGG